MQLLNIKSILILLLFTGTFIACEKDNSMTDEEAPLITLVSPSMSDSFMNGDTVHIHATITDNDELHEISAIITHTHMGTSQEVWNIDTHSHEETYTLHDEYVIDVAGMHNDFKLEFTVSDHNGNVGTEEFHFHVM